MHSFIYYVFYIYRFSFFYTLGLWLTLSILIWNLPQILKSSSWAEIQFWDKFNLKRNLWMHISMQTQSERHVRKPKENSRDVRGWQIEMEGKMSAISGGWGIRHPLSYLTLTSRCLFVCWEGAGAAVECLICHRGPGGLLRGSASA